MTRRGTIVLLSVLWAGVAWGQRANSPGLEGWGVRVGVADDPDQVVAGVQFDLGEIARRLFFRPDLELGVGDDHLVLAATAPVHYHFDTQTAFRPYAGGGISVGGIDHDHPHRRADDTEFEVAAKAIGGLGWELRGGVEFSIELDLVLGDLHDVELLAGWRF
jgi:hypothetical protein